MRLPLNRTGIARNDLREMRWNVRFVPVTKVPKCAATNFPLKDEQATIADRYFLNRVTEIACEFIAS